MLSGIILSIFLIYNQRFGMQNLIQKLIDFRKKRDWEQFHNPKDLSMSIAIEAAELMEEFQWKTREEVDLHIKDNKEKIADEIADIMTYLLLLAHDLDIDIKGAVNSKMDKNELKYPVEKCKSKNTKYTHLK